jgi:hypothetical protein
MGYPNNSARKQSARIEKFIKILIMKKLTILLGFYTFSEVVVRLVTSKGIEYGWGE